MTGAAIDAAAFAALERASRELHLACDADGIVRHADARAERILGIRRGGSLRRMVAPGCEAKLDDFLRRALTDQLDDYEVPFLVGGRPVTVSLCSISQAGPHAGPHAGPPALALIVGHVIPEPFVAALDQVNEMITEVVELNRTVTAQRNAIAAQVAELRRVNAELSEAHQGVLALHRELQEKSDQTQQDNEIKTRLVANLSHELRTPLHSILGLTHLLASGVDGALGSEQAKQVRFIRASADELLSLINDVLEARAMTEMIERSRNKPPGSASILVVEDDRHTLFPYEKYLVMAGFHVLPARTIDDAMALMRAHRPAAIVLDVMLEGDSSWGFLARLKSDPETQDIPVLVVTVTNREDKARALGADEFWLKPVDQERLLRKLREVAHGGPLARVLVIDDDDTARYIIRQHLAGTPYVVYEAATGEQGVAIAREHHPA